ncbi:MAG: hypothetical protein A2X86_08640 [Bdellovibrionales bacterium GWA2_49_15]|nr:MAG: hypothetical protein A2X86_08640 [Bdellovibrionales bacterium GWA2_49_15]HAZ11169.1 hypothetical protein [Bdellovibrionales bacterium]
MKNIFPTLLVSLSILVASLGSVSLASETVHNVRRQLNEGTINPDNTCVDEYIDEANKQIWKTGLTPPIGAAGTFALGFGGAMGGGLVAQLVGTVGWEALGFMGVGGFIGLCAGTATLATLETVAITKLVQTNFLIKVIAESRGGPQTIGKNFSKFLAKYDRKYPQDKIFSKADQAAAILNAADTELKLCDGSLVQKKGGLFRNKHRKLAKKNEIFDYLRARINTSI